jgi:hypothetical protein
MMPHPTTRRRSIPVISTIGAESVWYVKRVARVAYTFVLMNYAAVVALLAAMRGRKVWR